MRSSQMNLRSGLMERVQRKLDENQTNDNNVCEIIPHKLKVRRERTKQNMGWMLK